MKPYKIVFFEFLLIFASVLIFRSFWMILDSIDVMNNESVIWLSLIAGVLITLLSFLMLNKYVDSKKEK
ncbi:MAG: hypothetical protein JXN64_09250 [Spirochaetes bacterium]|nr:hypothetical protein [Spirochaetota bacterium]